MTMSAAVAAPAVWQIIFFQIHQYSILQLQSCKKDCTAINLLSAAQESPWHAGSAWWRLIYGMPAVFLRKR